MSDGCRRVGVIGFEGVNAMDVTGPLEVFATAGRADCTSRHSRGHYETLLIGLTGEPFRAESGPRFLPDCTLEEVPELDTLIVPGGWGLREPPVTAAVSSWVRAHAGRIRRVCSVCTGIYGLAPSGLLDGCRATTHWRLAEDVAQRFPEIHIERNALFLRDGRFYTSAGITAGIDLAMALVEEDLGLRTALAVARELVVYLKRPGGQEQYSEPLRFQALSAGRRSAGFADLIAWILGHLQQDLSVQALASRAGQSPRHFSRCFTAAVGSTPGEFVEMARLDAVRDRLGASSRTIDSIAASVGFRSADVMRRRFAARFGLSPSSYRERFAVSVLTGWKPGPGRAIAHAGS
jgi:transcriptional regulator GlxA family with amidase domain